VDIAYLFGGVIAEELRRTPGIKIAAPLVYGVYWLELPRPVDAKSPWHDQRVRLAASLAIDRQAINQAEMLGYGKLTGSFVPSTFEFALPIEPPAFDPQAREAAHRRRGLSERLRRRRPHAASSLFFRGRGHRRQAAGHRDPQQGAHHGARRIPLHVAREEAHGAPHRRPRGPRATPPPASSPSSPKAGTYAYGVLPEIEDLFQRQANELDRKKREALLHQIRRSVTGIRVARRDSTSDLPPWGWVCW